MAKTVKSKDFAAKLFNMGYGVVLYANDLTSITAVAVKDMEWSELSDFLDPEGDTTEEDFQGSIVITEHFSAEKMTRQVEELYARYGC